MLLRESVVELEPGSVLAGRYQIRRVLGKGATGVVLEADDRVSRSLVALKVFKPEIASDDRWQEVVGSELRHARQIMHPNVCRVFDAGEADGYRFLSMEFASGGSLRHRLKEAGSDRSFEARVADARAVVNGLAAIHAAGMIHRDVKPDNVLRMEDGRLVLTDFGLAVAPGQTTFVSGYSGAVGTPSYMAPEVALGGDASMASDVFSLGVLLHEIFFDRRPEWETTKRGRFLRSPVDRRSPRRLSMMGRLCAQCLEELAPRRPANGIEVKRRFERAVLGKYGTVVGALRTGKWGLVAGLGLSLSVALALLLIMRPSDLARKVRAVDAAKHLSSLGTFIARENGRIRCLSTSEDSKSVHVIWGAPARASKINAKTGEITPWNILPDTYRSSHCPALSHNGRRLAFTTGNESRQIMVSDNPDGSSARPITPGYAPQWLRNDEELIYFFDARRAGLIAPGGLPSLLPENSAVGETLMTASLSPNGDRLAVVYDSASKDGSLVLVHKVPSFEVVARYRTDVRVSSATFAPLTQELYLTASSSEGFSFYSLSPNGRFIRRSNQPGSQILLSASDSATIWLGVARLSATLAILGATGAPREIASAFDFGSVVFSSDGYAAIEEGLEDGRIVIGLYDPNTAKYSRLSKGRRDIGPLFTPDGSKIAYIDWAASRIQMCGVREPHDCRAILTGEKAWWLAGFSADGVRLGYFSGSGSTSRLRVVALGDRAVTDLGYSFLKRCPVRWTSSSRLWAFRETESPRWVEMDLARRGPTGASEPVKELGDDGCPVTGRKAARSSQVVRREESEVWRVGGRAN